MKLFFLLMPLLAFSQHDEFKLCDSLVIERWKLQYYSLNGKYPISSENLTKQINRRLLSHPRQITGFITIRFIVNCKGLIGKYEVYQTDDNYEKIEFEHRYVEQLLGFLKSLNSWKIATYEGKSYDYYTYITFKIEKGIVTEIVP
jgi:hypothetical protein